MPDLDEVRVRIDETDRQLAELFQKRLDLSKEAAEYKINSKMPVSDKQREIKKLEEMGKLAQTEFKKQGITEMFTQIMAISRKYQYQILAEHGMKNKLPFESVEKLDTEGKTVVFQGVEGAYSQAATRAYFGEDQKCFHVPSFKAAMEAVAKKEADYAVLPIENSSAGQVGDVYDLLLQYDNAIVAEVYLPVSHCLLGLLDARLEDIKTVYSHPQGLMQCQGYLNARPTWQQVSQANTAMAAKKVIDENDKTQAAIASKLAGELYGLKVLAEQVNDNRSNTTRFIVVTSKKQYCRTAKKVSICFEIAHESGTLYNLLSNFIYNNLNMSKIESRPISDRPFEYRFFVDFEGNLADAAVENALNGIEREAGKLKILGNY